MKANSHSIPIGYLLWFFGFIGAHRFYYGKPFTGMLYMATGGLLGIGWFIDLFLIPKMAQKADIRFIAGPIDYNVAWILLTFLGPLGIHRFYLGKWLTGILYFLTAGLLGIGWAYDFWTINAQIDRIHRSLT